MWIVFCCVGQRGGRAYGGGCGPPYLTARSESFQLKVGTFMLDSEFRC